MCDKFNHMTSLFIYHVSTYISHIHSPLEN